MEFVKIDPPEPKRTYLFPGGERVTVENVCAVCVRPSGGHRLETTDGRKWIIAPGWLAVELQGVAAWTF